MVEKIEQKIIVRCGRQDKKYDNETMIENKRKYFAKKKHFLKKQWK